MSPTSHKSRFFQQDMTGDSTWPRIKDLYLKIGDLTPEECEQTLQAAEAEDPEVATAVRKLLASDGSQVPNIARSVWNDQIERAYAFAIGQVLLNRFEIMEFLGAGGTGEVYKAYDQTQRIYVAVKTLQRGLHGQRAAHSAMRNEINAARQISHPGVCKIYDVHIEPGDDTLPFFTMEWIDGRTLSEVLRDSGPLPPDTVSHYAAQILDALEAAHNSHVIHRDLKSVNIMVAGDPAHLVIMDFGLARRLKKEPGRTQTETTLAAAIGGTLAYMSPELLRGGDATPASDLHAVGVMFFEMLSCRRPFEGADADIIVKRMVEDAPSLLTVSPQADRRWAYAIERCLESDPAKRPQSVAELRTILKDGPPLLWSRRRALFTGIAVIASAGALGSFGVRHIRSGPATIGIAEIEGVTGNTSFDEQCRRAVIELSSLLSKQGTARSFLTGKTARQMPDGGGARFLLGGTLDNRAGIGPLLQVELRDLALSVTRWTATFPVYAAKSLAEVLARQIASSVSGWTNASWSWQQSGADGEPQASLAAGTGGHGLALDHLIRAKTLLEDSSSRNVAEAERYLNMAVQEDPNFALVWSALADVHLAQISYTTGATQDRVVKARDAALKALSLDPNLAEAHCSLAAVYQFQWDWDRTALHYQEAMRLKPFFPRAHRWYAGFALQFGKIQETLDHLAVALRQDPHEKAATVGAVLYLLYCGRPQEAIALGEPVMDGRNLEGTRFNVGQAYVRMGQLTSGSESAGWMKKALEQAQQLEAIEQKGSASDSTRRALLSTRLFATTFAAVREYNSLRPHLDRLTEGERLGAYSANDLATPHALIGDLQTAMALLERARRNSPTSLLYIKVNPFLESLRGLSGFAALVQEMRL